MYHDLHDFLMDLSTNNSDEFSRQDIALIRRYVDSDGCTGVIDFYKDECVKHDFKYRTKHNFKGQLITRAEADADFRKDIITASRRRLPRKTSWKTWSNPINWWHYTCPLAWWRWVGVRLLAKNAWDNHESCH